MGAAEDLAAAVADGRMPETLPATNTGQGQVATGVYYVNGPGPNSGAASVTAGSLPAVGAVATQDIWMEVQIMPGTPKATTVGEQTGGTPGVQLTYYLVAKTGQPYFPPE